MFAVYNLVEFGNRLRLIRSENGLTQAKVREIASINEDTLRKIKPTNFYKSFYEDLLKA